MASYHCSVKTVSRSAGRSATGAVAYRAGCEIADERTGEIHNYTRKGGVVREASAIFVPEGAPAWATDRAKLWNAVEQAETRKNSTVAREFEIALPEELSPADRQKLAHDFAREIVRHHGCAVDVSIHEPGKGGDNRNHHAHILCSTRRLTPEGFTEKTRELDDQKSGPQIVTAWRARWADLQNERFAERGLSVRVDHRSLEAQGIDREPTQHLGPAATGYERRTGDKSDKRKRDEVAEAARTLAKAKELGQLERERRQLDRSILDLSGDLSAAKAQQAKRPTPEQVKAGRDAFRAGREQHKQMELAKVEAQRAEERKRAELAKLPEWRRALDIPVKNEPKPQPSPRPRGPSRDRDGPDFSM